MHNAEVTKSGKGEIAVKYRPKHSVNLLHYAMCDACLAYVSRKQLYHHRCEFSKAKCKPLARRNNLLCGGWSTCLEQLAD